MLSEFSTLIAHHKPWYQWRNAQVLQEQVALVRSNFAPTLAASAAGALATLWAMYTVVDHAPLWWWLASHLLVLCGVYAVQRWWLLPGRRPTHNAWAILVCMSTLGLSWGSIAWVCVAYGQPIALVYAIALVGGASSGALGLGGPLLPAYVAYLTPPVSMIALAFAYVGGPMFLPFTSIAIIFYILTCMQARNMQRAALQGIALQFENTALVQRLQHESAQSHTALAKAEAAQQLAQTTQAAAETANTDKSKFLAAASHDLRQPLHAMGLFLETLSRSDLSEQQLTVVNHAHAASTAASEMLTTLLDFSRLEAGVVKSVPKPFFLQPMLAKLEQEFGLQADAKELFYRSRETSLAAVADPNLTDLVLRNFISNAIRYTDHGGVLVACRFRGGAAVVEVWDTGIGIPANQHAEVFKEFHQLGNPERDRRKGLGLGLAIVERISSAMNAKVTLRSVPERGSVFRLWLECYQGSIVYDRGAESSSKDLRNLRVLVIDDEEPVRLGMQELLRSWGCICHTADAVSSALHCVAMLGLHEQPQVILADYRLREGATGGQAINALRTYLTLRGHDAPLPAIIITGDTAPERLREAQQTDAALLHKPVSAQALQQALLQLR
jgi:signal transduction histidine kinase/CheY-like chemotaxis protein